MESKALILLIWRGARLLMVGFILGAALGFVVSRIQMPVYEAKTQVLISRARLQTNTDMLPLDEEQLVSTNIQLLKSRPVLDAVSAQLGVNVKADNVAVSAVPNTLILQIKVQDPNAQGAADIANTLVQVLMQRNQSLVDERYTAFENNLNGQIDQIQTQIHELQNQINEINAASIQQQLTQVNQQIGQIRSELSTLEYEINSYPSILSEMQRLSLSEKQARLEQLRSLLGIYQQIQTNLTFIGKPGQNGLSLDDPRLGSLQSTLALYQELYLDLVNSRETVSLDRMQNTPNLTQINPAVPPKDPVRPLPLLYILLGGTVGFFIAATAILTLDHLDESVKTSTQAEETLRLPVLGSITDSSDIRDELVTLQRPASKGAEIFRALGMKLDFAVAKKCVHTLLILGADPDAAKTTIAANLGIALAQRGKRVVLLDGDLNAPHLHSLFGMDAEPGVADLLLEHDVDIRSVSHPVTGIEGMMLMPGGTVTENLMGWRNGDRWQDILIQLQKQADLVIIDGPSVETASAHLFASNVDAVLLSIQLGKTRVDSAMTALRHLQFVGARVAGAVVYRAPKYRTIQLRNFRWARANQKGGSRESRNTVSEKTIALS